MDEKLKEYERIRVNVRRKNERLLKSLRQLNEAGIIESEELERFRRKVAEFFEAAKARRLAQRPVEHRKPGPAPRLPSLKCRRPGCDKPAKNGYCSREHAPLGNWGERGPVFREVG